MPSTLITGTNRGLGLEFARQYLADGQQVHAGCRDPDSAPELRRLADASGHKLQILALDVTDAANVKTTAAKLKGQAIDLLLNNAGVMGPRGQTIGNIDYEAWAKVLEANTMGPMRVSEAFVDHVARRRPLRARKPGQSSQTTGLLLWDWPVIHKKRQRPETY